MGNISKQNDIYRSIIESISDSLIILNKKYEYIFMNKAAEEAIGKTFLEVANRSMWDLFPQILSSRFREACEKVMNERITLDVEEYFPFYEIWSEHNIYPHEEGISILTKTITGRKKKELEDTLLVQKSNERFDLLGRIAQDALWEMDLETGNKWANEVHQNLYGLTIKDPVPDEKEWKERIHPNDRQKTVESEAIATRGKNEKFLQEYRFYAEGKGWIDILDRTFLIMDHKGKLIRKLGSMLDITNLKTAERRMFEEKTISDSIISSLPGIFYLFDENDNQIRWNENLRLTSKYSNAEIVHMSPLDFIKPEDREKVAEAIESIKTAGYAEVEACLLTKEGEIIPFYFNGKEVEIDGKRCILGAGTDLTRIKAAENKLKIMENKIAEQKIQHQKKVSRAIIQGQEKERNHLAAELHDNVNQLLAGTRLYLNMAGKSCPGASEAIAYPLTLLDQTIEEIRVLSRKHVTPQKHVNLHKLLSTLIENLQKSSKIETEFNYEVEESQIQDELKINIYRILQEETNNIIRHSQGTKVKLDVYTKNDWIHISTQDNGVGCDLNSKKEGVGLRNIINRVEAFNGEIEMYNIAPSGFCIQIKIQLKEAGLN